MLGVILTLALAAATASSSLNNHEIKNKLHETTTALTSSVAMVTVPPSHSIHERAAVNPLSEEGEVDTVAGGEEGEEEIGGEEPTGRREERDCYRAADIFSRRSALDKNFMRFGRSGGIPASRKDSDGFDRFGRNRNFIRFGRAGPGGPSPGNNFIRLGRSQEENEEEDRDGYGKAVGDETTGARFVRGSANNFMRFGRGDSSEGSFIPSETQRPTEESFDGQFDRYVRNQLDRNFMRFGRGSATNFMRFGRQQPGNLDRNFMRLGRSKSDDSLDRVYRANLDRNFMRFGRSSDRNFIRFGRGSSNNFMRFGRSGEEEEVGKDFDGQWPGEEAVKDIVPEKSDGGVLSRSKRSTSEDGGRSPSDVALVADNGELTPVTPYGLSSSSSASHVSPLSAYLFSPELFLIPSAGRGAIEGRERRGRNFIRFG